jgi:CheY-like chemotaxis protein
MKRLQHNGKPSCEQGDEVELISATAEAPDRVAVSTVSTCSGDFLVLVVDDSPLDRRLVGDVLREQSRARIRYAEHGLAALKVMETERPDLVLTDMMMPEMDGLSLVEAMRRRFPLIPTILMTAHGSEETAILALERGAASYVPKRNLSRRLMETVTQVLSVSRLDREQSRVHECWSRTEFVFCLENDAALIPALVAHLQQYVAKVRGCDETELFRIGVALHEALRNAIHHGNLELNSELRETHPEAYYREAQTRRTQTPYCHRKVLLTALESRTESRYTIQDEGPGFDTTTAFFDPRRTTDLAGNNGRGLFLIHTFMDEVHFNDRGNEITMVHRRFGPAR